MLLQQCELAADAVGVVVVRLRATAGKRVSLYWRTAVTTGFCDAARLDVDLKSDGAFTPKPIDFHPASETRGCS